VATARAGPARPLAAMDDSSLRVPVRRAWEVDLARTLVLAAMVAYHVVYDIDFLSPGLGPDPRAGFWGALPPVIASGFLALAGMTTVLSGRVGAPWYRLTRWARRIAVLAAAAGLVSVATAVAVPDRWVRFGILHLMLVCAIATPVLRRMPSWSLALLAVVLVAARPMVEGLAGDAWLVPLGAPPGGFTTVDYWPLVPWAAAFVVGILIGRVLYGDAGRLRRRSPVGAFASLITAPGRHSLTVYLVHQPVLLVVLVIVLVLAGADVVWP
jgi:uncharacterized membrane protein